MYLYDFIYLRQNMSYSVLFNLFNKKILMSDNFKVNRLLKKIEDTKLTYKGCFMSDFEYEDPAVKKFIDDIVEYSFGGFLIVDKDKAPVQFPSEVYVRGYDEEDNALVLKYLNRDLNKCKCIEFQFFEHRVCEGIYDNFMTLTLFLSSYSNIKYKNISNQYYFPPFMLDDIVLDSEAVLKWIFPHKPKKINLVIGRFNDEIISDLMNILSLNISCVNIYVLYSELDTLLDIVRQYSNCFIYVWCISGDNFDGIRNFSDKIESYYCLCENRDDVDYFESFDADELMTVVPFYNGKNYEFCMQYLSYSLRELFDEIDEELYFRINSMINSNIFGEINIDVFGDVYTDINKNKVGCISDSSLLQILRMELLRNRNWFFTRRHLENCMGCLYSDLCPPISNFENYTKKYRLCKCME